MRVRAYVLDLGFRDLGSGCWVRVQELEWGTKTKGLRFKYLGLGMLVKGLCVLGFRV